MEIQRFPVSSSLFMGPKTPLPPPMCFAYSKKWRTVNTDSNSIIESCLDLERLMSCEDYFGNDDDSSGTNTPESESSEYSPRSSVNLDSKSEDIASTRGDIGLIHLLSREHHLGIDNEAELKLKMHIQQALIEKGIDSEYDWHLFSPSNEDNKVSVQIRKGKRKRDEGEDLVVIPPPDVDSKNKRKRKTPKQLAILESEFAKNPMPNKDIRERLGLTLGLTSRQVQIWFQNRRAKVKNNGGRIARKKDLSPEVLEQINSLKHSDGASEIEDDNISTDSSELVVAHASCGPNPQADTFLTSCLDLSDWEGACSKRMEQ